MKKRVPALCNTPPCSGGHEGKFPTLIQKTGKDSREVGSSSSSLVIKEQQVLNLILKTSADLHETATQWHHGHMLKHHPRGLRASGAPE